MPQRGNGGRTGACIGRKCRSAWIEEPERRRRDTRGRCGLCSSKCVQKWQRGPCTSPSQNMMMPCTLNIRDAYGHKGGTTEPKGSAHRLMPDLNTTTGIIPRCFGFKTGWSPNYRDTSAIMMRGRNINEWPAKAVTLLFVLLLRLGLYSVVELAFRSGLYTAAERFRRPQSHVVTLSTQLAAFVRHNPTCAHRNNTPSPRCTSCTAFRY